MVWIFRLQVNDRVVFVIQLFFFFVMLGQLQFFFVLEMFYFFVVDFLVFDVKEFGNFEFFSDVKYCLLVSGCLQWLYFLVNLIKVSWRLLLFFVMVLQFWVDCVMLIVLQVCCLDELSFWCMWIMVWCRLVIVRFLVLKSLGFFLRLVC